MDNEFEKAKEGLELSKNLEAVTVKNPLFRLVARLFPVIGDTALDVAESGFNKYQESKINFLIEHITNSGVLITSEMVEDVDFILDFRRVLDAVLRVRGNDKIKYFANMLINGHLEDSKN